jgi:hypothetical protein
MAPDRAVVRCRIWYRRLLRLYPKGYRDRFGGEMEQTFDDLLRECAGDERGLIARALWLFRETTAAIVRERVRSMATFVGGIGRAALATGLLLLIPLLAMRFSDEVNWSLSDFVLMGTLIFGTALALELIVRRARSLAHRAALAIALAASFLLVWVNLAVGIIGDVGGPNALYLGVLAVGLGGAIITRVRPSGMALTMLLMALAQMLVPVFALFFARSEMVTQPPGLAGVIALNACFAALFVASAWLFRRSVAQIPTPDIALHP